MHKSDTKTFGRSRDEKDVDPPPFPKKNPTIWIRCLTKKINQNKQLTANILKNSLQNADVTKTHEVLV